MRKKHRIVSRFLFTLYSAFLIYFLIFSDWYGRTGVMQEYHYNLELFREIKRFWTHREQLGFLVTATNLLGNIFIFVPFGFFMALASKKRSLIVTTFFSCMLSLTVEIFQLISRVGSFDVDDLLLNTIGGILGYVVYIIMEKVRRRHDTTGKI